MFRQERDIINLDKMYEEAAQLTERDNTLKNSNKSISKYNNNNKFNNLSERKQRVYLNSYQIRQIKLALDSGVHQKVLAERFNVSQNTISNIKTGRLKR